MFIRDAGPSGVPPSHGQYAWCPSFGFDLSNPNLFLKQNRRNLHAASGKQAAFCAGLQDMATGHSAHRPDNFNLQRPMPQQLQLRSNDLDQSLVWFQNMDDPNEAFRGQPGTGQHAGPNEYTLASGQTSQQLTTQSTKRRKRSNTNGPHLTNPKPSNGGFKAEQNANLWNATPNPTSVNHNFTHPVNFQGLRNWSSVLNRGNEYIDPFSLPNAGTDGLPTFANPQHIAPTVGFGQAMGGVPNVGSSSSSSYRINGSPPNTVFGSFSSSIGQADLVNMDVADECFHGPSGAFPSGQSFSQTTGAMPLSIFSQYAVQNYRSSPGLVVPEDETVSPRMLHIKKEPSLPKSSSSESPSNPFRMDSDSDVASATSALNEGFIPSSSQKARQSGPGLNAAGRKQLPDKAPHSKTSVPSNGPKRRHASEAAGDKAPGPSSKKSKSKTKASYFPKSLSQSQPQPPTPSHNHRHHRHVNTEGSDHQAEDNHSRTNKTVIPAGVKIDTTGSSLIPRRAEKDEYLVQSKLAGMTYKEIRKNGGFVEAESTLRGRFRTLTKPKEARVRKPEFQEVDDKLLKQAVVKFAKNANDITRDNVPWKSVAEYMDQNGGSYLFGYTTVRKRWEYLVATSDEQVKRDRLASREST